MNGNDAGRIIAVIDSRIAKHTKAGAQIETTWGEVCGISADGKYASAYLYGETDYPSEGFRIPGSMALSIGDKVKVAWDGRGERWVYDVGVPSAYKKIEIDVNAGEIRAGDGTVAPTPIDLGGTHNHDADYAPVVHDHTHDHDADYEPAGAVSTAITAHEAAGDPHPGYATDAHTHDSLYQQLAGNQKGYGISLTRSTTITVPNSTWTKITGWTTDWHLGAVYSVSGDDIIVPWTGLYMVTLMYVVSPQDSGQVLGGWIINDASQPATDQHIRPAFGSTQNQHQSVTGVESLTAGDDIGAMVWQNSGESETLQYARLTAVWIGEA